MFSRSLFNLKPVGGAFGAEDVRIMLIEMVTRLAKLQIVALPTPGNPIERQRSPALPQNCIHTKLHSRKSIRLLFVENILVRWNVRGKRVIGYYRGIHFI